MGITFGVVRGSTFGVVRGSTFGVVRGSASGVGFLCISSRFLCINKSMYTSYIRTYIRIFPGGAPAPPRPPQFRLRRYDQTVPKFPSEILQTSSLKPEPEI